MIRSVEKQRRLAHSDLLSQLAFDPVTGIFRWKLSTRNTKPGQIAGSLSNAGYRLICINNRRYCAHRLAWFYVYGYWPEYIDHRDRCLDNNAIANLRDCNLTQNRANSIKSRSNKSGFKGVIFHKKLGKWMARLSPRSGQIYLGVFDRPEDAHAAYQDAAKQMFGEFARP